MSGNDYPHYYAHGHLARTLPSPVMLTTRGTNMAPQPAYHDYAAIAPAPGALNNTAHYSAMHTAASMATNGNGGFPINGATYEVNANGSIVHSPIHAASNMSIRPMGNPLSPMHDPVGIASVSTTASMAAQYLEASSQSATKRQRVSRACDACRRKKVRCYGVRPICGNCSAFHIECTYLDAAKKRGPPKGYIEAIEHRLRRMETLLGGLVRHDPRLESVAREIDITELDNMDMEAGGGDTDGDGDDRRGSGAGKRGRQTMAWSHRLETVDRILTQATRGLGLDDKTIAALRQAAGDDDDDEGLGEIGYDRGSRPRRASRARSRSPSEGLSDLEVMIEDESSDAARGDPRRRSELPGPERTDENVQVAYDNQGKLRYMGGSSGAYLIVDRRHNGAGAESALDAFAAGIPDAQATAERLLQHLATPAPMYRRMKASVELPPPELSNRLISIYFARLHPFHPFVHKAAFLRCLRDHNRPPLLLLNAIYAIAARWANDTSLYAETGKPLTAGQVFFDRARILLDDEYDRSELTTVQALLLMSFYQHGCSQSMSSWLLAGMAFRMAHDLGLHRDCERWGVDRMDRIEKETRRRVWWACFVVDSMTSAALGRPLAIDERDIDAQLPRLDEDEEVDLDAEEEAALAATEIGAVASGGRLKRGLAQSLSVAAALPGGLSGPQRPASSSPPSENAQLSVAPSAKPSPVLYYIQLIKLAELMAKVLRNVYGPRAARNNLYEVTSRMDVELDMWVSRLPLPYRYREEDFTYSSTTISPFTGLLHIFYDVTRILLHRPLIALPPVPLSSIGQSGNGSGIENPIDNATATPANETSTPPATDEQTTVGGWNSFKVCCDAAQRITRIADCMRVGGYLRCHGIIFIGYSLFQASIVHLNNAVAPDEAIRRPARGHLALGLQALNEVQKDWVSAKQCRAILLDLMEVRGIQLTDADYCNVPGGTRRTNRRNAPSTAKTFRPTNINASAQPASDSAAIHSPTTPSSNPLTPAVISPITTSVTSMKAEPHSPITLRSYNEAIAADSLAALSSNANAAAAAAAAIVSSANNKGSADSSASPISLNNALFPPSYGFSAATSSLFAIPGVQLAAADPNSAAALMMAHAASQNSLNVPLVGTGVTDGANQSTGVPVSHSNNPHHQQQSHVQYPNVSYGHNPSNTISWDEPPSLDSTTWQEYLRRFALPNIHLAGVQAGSMVVAEGPIIYPPTPTAAASASNGLVTAGTPTHPYAPTPDQLLQSMLNNNGGGGGVSSAQVVTGVPTATTVATAAGMLQPVTLLPQRGRPPQQHFHQ